MGDRESLGELLAQCRGYLLAIAHAELDETLRGKLAVSDVVQETLLRVQQNFAGFRGTAEDELLAWLRQILANYLKDVRRSFRRTEKRNIEREVHGRFRSDASAIGVEGVAVDSVTPGRTVAALEETERLRAALAGLPDEYRTVLALRTWERLSFDEVGRRMGRSADAARMLWARAVKKLTAALRDVSDDQL
jgi:RNA polymerase sigma-70 factor (ECF subfamily)